MLSVGSCSLGRVLGPTDTPCCGAPGWVIWSKDRTNAALHELSTGVSSAVPRLLAAAGAVGKKYRRS